MGGLASAMGFVIVRACAAWHVAAIGGWTSGVDEFVAVDGFDESSRWLCPVRKEIPYTTVDATNATDFKFRDVVEVRCSPTVATIDEQRGCGVRDDLVFAAASVRQLKSRGGVGLALARGNLHGTGLFRFIQSKYYAPLSVMGRNGLPAGCVGSVVRRDRELCARQWRQLALQLARE
jgi:hypothetical protein